MTVQSYESNGSVVRDGQKDKLNVRDYYERSTEQHAFMQTYSTWYFHALLFHPGTDTAARFTQHMQASKCLISGH